MAAAVLEGSCGTLIYGVRHTDRLVPASLTKMATAMVVAENRALTERVDITQNGWWLASTDGSSIMGLEEGMNLSVRDLLVGMLLPSGNDAALQLAEYMGGTPVIVRLMNQRVQQMGLTNTFFVNPDGRDATPGNYSTALDMALIGREMMANPILREIAGTPLIHPEWSGHALWNANYLVHSYPGAFGVKSGYTDLARETLVGGVVWEGRELYVSILGSNFVYYDAFALLDWAYDHTTPVC